MRKKTSAYTLIELIVVIAIMGVILSIGLARWTSYQNKEKLRTETQKVTSWLETIHTKALQGEKPRMNCPTLNYYHVRKEGNDLVADAYCLDRVGDDEIFSGVSSLSVNDLITLENFSSFNFLSNTGITELSSPRQISLTYSGPGLSSTITITYSGKISWQMN